MSTMTTTTTLANDLPKFTREMCEQFFIDNRRVTIVFKKKDGTLRTMHCTRSTVLIPEQYHLKEAKEGDPPKKTSDTSLSVFEFGTGWRSFTIENLISMEVNK